MVLSYHIPFYELVLVCTRRRKPSLITETFSLEEEDKLEKRKKYFEEMGYKCVKGFVMYG